LTNPLIFYKMRCEIPHNAGTNPLIFYKMRCEIPHNAGTNPLIFYKMRCEIPHNAGTNPLIFIQTDVKSRRIGGATQPSDTRWGFETTSSVVSHKNSTKILWHILGQLSFLQASGHWLLAAGLLSLVTGCLSLARPAARGQ
jgi:hypothetical protein